MKDRMHRRVLALALAAVGAVTGALASVTPAHADGPYEFYRIVNYTSNKCLQPQSRDNAALIEQRSCSSSTAQWWHFDYSPGTPDRYITNVWSGHCLANGTPSVAVRQLECAPAAPVQRWIEPIVRVGGHVQMITRVTNSTCIDIAGNSSSNGALAIMSGCWVGDPSQAFRYERVN